MVSALALVLTTSVLDCTVIEIRHFLPRLLLVIMFYQNRNNIFFEIEILRHKYKMNIVKTKKKETKQSKTMQG